ncbi:EFR1 family ferrodoxin [Draconibacterium sp. IB214405]|uniref:EFR1 family ferrodoxin n=1 Tax=Draconibacterium sp. IB214405 TaxID=3097352 RepID=UPI002A1024DF|nr:EFR1 family ferrodoxin [Draconibacterium sp. IB214405]MDX8340330.1 EFR1 family ferrodoxin [Draconibacterium sp. IB214405]
MKKAMIATFSQSGSTNKIADQIEKGITSGEWDIDRINIGQNSNTDVSGYDLVGIGSPTYFFNPPFIVQDFVNELKGLKNKPTFVFVLHGTYVGDCGNWIRRTLKMKEAKDYGYFTSYGVDYWMGYIKRGTMFSPDSPTKKELHSAEEFGKSVINSFSEQQQNKIAPFDPPTPFVYRIERLLVARSSVKSFYYKTFTVNSDCNNCGICVEKCPVNNITQQEDGTLKWDSNCQLCATCEMNCPKDAIRSSLDWKTMDPFMNYNIRISKKKKIPFVHVKHTHGKTQLVEN